MTTTLTATPRTGGAFYPAHVELQVEGAPVVPTSVYTSNFTSGVDSFAASGTGAAIANDVATTPDSLKLTGPTASTGEADAARLVTGLTIGAQYRLKAWVKRAYGQVRVKVTTADGVTTLTTTAWLATKQATRTLVQVTFTATATAHTLHFTTRQTPAAPGLFAEYRLDTITVTPSGSWAGTTFYRTDANGTDLPVRNSRDLDTPAGNLLLRDYECALVGPVAYRVVDGLGATATATCSFAGGRVNSCTHPVAENVTAVGAWVGTGATLAVQSTDRIRATLTTATTADLAQRATLADLTTQLDVGAPFQVRAQARGVIDYTAAAVSMVEVANGTAGSTGTNPTVNVTATPQAGDVVIVTLQGGSSGTSITALTGLGATWSLVTNQNANTPSHSVWKGVGATVSGTATLTVSGSSNGAVRAFLIRGLSSTAADVASTFSSGTGALAGPTGNAAHGQLALELGAATVKTSGNLLEGTTPTTGWQIQTGPAGATGYYHTAYRIPVETTPTAHQATVATGSSASRRVTSIMLGTSYPPASSANAVAAARVIFRDELDALVDQAETLPVEIHDTAWVDLLIDTVVPESTHHLDIDVGAADDIPRTIGNWVEFRRVYAGAPGEYMDGNTPDTADYDYSWVGAEHASASVETPTGPVEMAPSLTLPATELDTVYVPPQWAELTMATSYDEASETQGSVHVILGRTDKLSNPGPLLARTGTLELFNLDYPAAVGIRDLLRNADVAMFRQATYPGLDLYLVARNVRIVPAEPTDPRRWLVTVDYDEVPRP